MTDRYTSIATPVDHSRAEALRRQLHARLDAGPESALITAPAETEPEELPMSIEELDRTEQRGEQRRSRIVAVGTGIVLAAAAIVAVAVIATRDDDDGASADSSVPQLTAALTTPVTTTLSGAICPDGMGACRGELLAGTYTSTAFEPGVSYTVRDGWNNVEDTAGVLGMTAQTSAGLVDVYVVSRVRVPDGCMEVPDPAVGPTSADIAAAYTAAEELVTSTPQPVTVGGLTGLVIDVSMDPAWTGTCQFFTGERSAENALPVAFHIIGESQSSGFATALWAPDTERLYLLDYDGGTLAVQIHAPSGRVDSGGAAPIADFIDEITPFVESLQFNGVG